MSCILDRGAEIHRLSKEKHGRGRRRGSIGRRNSNDGGDETDEENSDHANGNGAIVKQLTLADLYSVPSSMKASVLWPRFK